MKLGLWTEDGIDKLADQVKAGQRVAKLDVAWVGDGYKFALDGCKDAYRGIEDNSDARGFTWAPESWSGAQRCGVQWSGDQSGTWDYIRWQIPTYAGATLSGLAYTTGDVDGIFGGSAKTYVRDLEWKSFLPAMMTMDGWAASDKQPYRHGEPYTSISRKYLKLKESLLPYMYSYAARGDPDRRRAGAPAVAGVPRRPEGRHRRRQVRVPDRRGLPRRARLQGQRHPRRHLSAEGHLGRLLGGRTYQGPATVDGYSAPLDTLPLFVKAGAAVPMWPGIRSYQDRTARLAARLGHLSAGPLLVHALRGRRGDPCAPGRPQRHPAGARSTAPRSGGGRRTDRRRRLPGLVPRQADGPAVPVHRAHRGRAARGRAGRPGAAAAAFRGRVRGGAGGLVPRPGDRRGVVRIKTALPPTDRAFGLKLTGASAVGGRTPGAAVTVTSPGGQEVTKGAATTVRTAVTAGTRTAHGVSVSLSAPEGWTVSAPVRHARIAAGTTRHDALTLTAPEDARSADPVTVTATVRYRSAGAPRTAVHRFEVRPVPPAPSGDTWASDLEWLSEANGYGPAERDRSNGESGASDGHRLTLAGKTYDKGIGTHADSDVEFFAGGRCTSFTADAGIDDEIADYGEAAFSVEADGKVLWTSPKLTGKSAPVAVDVPLGGARHVRLKVTDTDGKKSGDHGDWAGARFHCSG